MDDFYKPGQIELQQEFASDKLARRLQKVILHDHLTEEEQTFIAAQNMVFVSSVDENGQPTVSYKGGDNGFVKILDNKTLALPGYDGNGMFLTAGNARSGKKIGLLFIDFANPNRLRVHGESEVITAGPLVEEFHEALYVMRINITQVFMNCGRYIHPHQKLETSQFVPRKDRPTPEPDWKQLSIFSDVLPPKKT